MRFSEINEAVRTGMRDTNNINTDEFQIGVEIEFLAIKSPNKDGFHEGDDAIIKPITNSFKRILGISIESKSVFDKSPNKIPDTWVLTTDGSVQPTKNGELDKSYKDYEYAGLEIISPPMSFDDYSKYIPRVFHWMNDNKFITNKTTGFHINISYKDPNKMKEVDPLKLILFSGGDHLKTLFKRIIEKDHQGRNIDYIRGNIEQFKRSIQHAYDAPNIKAKTIKDFSALFKKIIDSDTDGYLRQLGIPKWKTKRHAVNIANLDKHGYIEFRVVGGDNYINRWDEISNITKRFLISLNASTDPGTDQEYAKKLYKIFQDALAEEPIEYENDSPMVKLNNEFLKSLLPKFQILMKDATEARRIYNLLKIYDLKGKADGNWQLISYIIQLLKYHHNLAISPTIRSAFISLIKKYGLTSDDVKKYYEIHYYDYDPETKDMSDEEDEYWGDKTPSEIPLETVTRYLMLK